MKKLFLVSMVLQLLCSCETVSTRDLAADIDPVLEQASDSYPIYRAKTFSSDGQLNVSAGPFQVAEADTGWGITTSYTSSGINLLFDAIDQEDYSFRQKLSFSFSDAEQRQWQGLCEIRSEGSIMDIDFGRNSNLTLQNDYDSAYRCGFLTNGLQWNLVLDRRAGRDTQAYIESAEGKRWNLEAFDQDNTFQSRQTLNIFLGYYLLDNEDAAGAVSLLEDGQFWLHQDLSDYEKSGLAIAAIGLWYSRNAFIEVSDLGDD